MSLGVVIKGPEGVVLAADSRVTLTAVPPGGQPLLVNFDNATKLLTFTKPHNYVGAVTYGAAVIGLRTAHSYIPELELDLPEERGTVRDFAVAMSDFYLARWRETMPADYVGPPMTFVVGGYDPEAAYGSVYVVAIPDAPEPVARNPGDDDFGMTWGGQLEVASRLIHGYDPIVPDVLQQALGLTDEQVGVARQAMTAKTELRIPYKVLPLQDSVDLATFLLRTTMTAQALSIGIRGVGGPVEVATITRIQGVQFVQRKEIHGEAR